MLKYDGFVRMELLCWVKKVEAKNEATALEIANKEAGDFVERLQSEYYPDCNVEISSYCHADEPGWVEESEDDEDFED